MKSGGVGTLVHCSNSVHCILVHCNLVFTFYFLICKRFTQKCDWLMFGPRCLASPSQDEKTTSTLVNLVLSWFGNWSGSCERNVERETVLRRSLNLNFAENFPLQRQKNDSSVTFNLRAGLAISNGLVLISHAIVISLWGECSSDIFRRISSGSLGHFCSVYSWNSCTH